MKRVNGLSRPFHVLQLSSWLALLLFLASFHLLCLPILLHHALLPVFLVLCWLLTALLFISAYICCRRDPSIPPFTASISPLPTPDSSKECRWCSLTVTLDTHHCRLCDKCVPGFDHHCLWLNTCIGRSNYNTFFLALVAVCSFLLYQCAVLAYCVAEVAGSAAWRSSVAEVYGSVSIISSAEGGRAVLLALLSLSGCLHLCALLPVSHLLALHVWLWRQRLTTYAWIVQSRNQSLSAPVVGKAVEALPVNEVQMAAKDKSAMDEQSVAEEPTVAVIITMAVAAEESAEQMPNAVVVDDQV